MIGEQIYKAFIPAQIGHMQILPSVDTAGSTNLAFSSPKLLIPLHVFNEFYHVIVKSHLLLW